MIQIFMFIIALIFVLCIAVLFAIANLFGIPEQLQISVAYFF